MLFGVVVTDGAGEKGVGVLEEGEGIIHSCAHRSGSPANQGEPDYSIHQGFMLYAQWRNNFHGDLSIPFPPPSSSLRLYSSLKQLTL